MGVMDLPAETQLRWTIGRMARLLDLGAEPVRGLVLPDGNFFPDRFDGTPESVEALFRRTLGHAGLGDLDVHLGLVTAEGETKSCSSGACGGGGDIDVRVTRVQRRGAGYDVLVPAGEIGHPVVLTTGLVRSVATMFLFEVDGYEEFDPREAEPVTDLAAALLGFGVLVTNGAYVYMKGCSGARVHAATKLPLDQLSIALATFCALHGVDAGLARRHLELTQREAFDEATAWARSNASLVRSLRDNRRAIVADAYRIAPARSWLARALGIGGKRKPDPTDDLDELERALAAGTPKPAREIDAAKQQRLAELRKLVDESL
jgi:hypothetical protein